MNRRNGEYLYGCGLLTHYSIKGESDYIWRLMGWTKQKHKVPRDIAGKQWESVGKPPVHGPDCSAA